MRYSDHEQRQMDIASGLELDRHAARRAQRAEMLLNAIQDDVVMRLNPSGEDCWHCGGEEYTHDCFDGFCEDADTGCEDCARPCHECVLFKGQLAKAVREEVIKLNDTDVAIAWLKSIGRWTEDITVERVRTELADAASKQESAAD